MKPKHFEMIAKAFADARPDHIVDVIDHGVEYNRWLRSMHEVASVLSKRHARTFGRSKFIDQCKFGVAV